MKDVHSSLLFIGSWITMMGVDGAPNGITAPRWSLSKPHLRGTRPWASVIGILSLSRGSGSAWRGRHRAQVAARGPCRNSSPSLSGLRTV